MLMSWMGLATTLVGFGFTIEQFFERLEQLEKTLPKDGFVSAYDPSIVEFSGKPKYYFYERVGTDNYYLRGLGPDGKPFTPDDIVPQIATTAGGKLGLLFERR